MPSSFKKFIRIIYLLIVVFSCSYEAYTQGKYLDSIKQMLPHQKNDSNKVNLLLGISIETAFADPDTSIKYGLQALQLSETINFQTGILWATMSLTMSNALLGNYPIAIDNGFKANMLAKKIGTPLDNIISMGNLGQCYHYLGDYDAGLEYMRSSVRMVEKSFPDSLAFIYAGFSQAFEDVSKHDSALFYAKKSYQQLKQWQYLDKFSSIYPILGNAYASNAQHDSALLYYRFGIDVSKKLNVLSDEIDNYNGIAKLYSAIGYTDSAIWYAKKVLALKIGKSYRNASLNAAQILTSVYESKKQSDSALKYLLITMDLKDGLFNRQNTIAIQKIEYNERQKQIDLAASKREYDSRIKMWALIVGAVILLAITIFLWRNNRQKQKAYTLLQEQERETDHQKRKVEQSLLDLKSTQSLLIQSEKMASLGEMTAGVAHEIQNPLNFVNNFAEINRELVAELKKQRSAFNMGEEEEILLNDIDQNLEKINHHGKRADAIVKSMLQHSRASGGQKEATDINALAEEYLRLSYNGLRIKDKSFHVTLDYQFDAALNKVDIIPQDIGRVLINLYINAFYAVSEKMKLAINDFEPRVTVSTKNLGEKLEIRVKDNGNGIPEKWKDKIFQPFFTTKPTGQGAGLGLSLSHDIIKAHNGELKVESHEGEGTTMVIYIPV